MLERVSRVPGFGMRTRPTKVIKRVREKHILRVVILAGDRGSRLSEETDVKPKPMVEIGGKPFLWHIMKHYAHCGFEEFFIALGYKGEMVKPYFLDYHSLQGSMSIDLSKGEVRTHKKDHEEWLVHLFDTGIDTNTGGRIKRLQPWLEDETFMVERIERISRDVLD